MASGNFNHRVNGCEPSSYIRESRQPRGGIVRRQGTTTVLDTAGNEHSLRKSKLLVTIKSGSRKQFCLFYSFCRKHNLSFVEPRKPIPVVERFVDVETGEYVYDEQERTREPNAVYEVTGANCHLLQLAKLSCIVGYTWALNVGEPHFGSPQFQGKSISVKHTSEELFSDCPNVYYKGKEM